MNNEIKKFIIKTRPLYLTKTKLYNGHFYIGYSHRICLGDSLYNVNEISKSDAEYLLDRDIKKISRQFNKYIKEDKIDKLMLFDVEDPLLERTAVLAYKKDKRLSRIANEFLLMAKTLS